MGVRIFPWAQVSAGLLLAGLGVAALRGEARAAEAPFAAALAIELQPLRGVADKPEALAAPLRPLALAYKKGQWAKACSASAARRQALLQRAAKIFFGMERKKADVEAIERFLDAHVRGDRPELEVAGEGFVAAAAWRSLAVDACVRADLPAQAIAMIDQSASLAGDGPALVALAVARAQAERRWSAAAAVVARSGDSLRVALIRALARPEEARHWLTIAEAHAQTGADQQLIAAVRKLAGPP